ncbi:unnamed protein product [Symbiodinium microadriaticum]|nr:unnamed protein product [Symbiodinium microadriaticum]CAE7935412.1 unnamed protein product [Symbiodinium sp. KB8]
MEQAAANVDQAAATVEQAAANVEQPAVKVEQAAVKVERPAVKEEPVNKVDSPNKITVHHSDTEEAPSSPEMLPDLPKIPINTVWNESTGKLELESPAAKVEPKSAEPKSAEPKSAEPTEPKTEEPMFEDAKEEADADTKVGGSGRLYNGKRMKTAQDYMQDYDVPNEQVYREVYLYAASLADMLCRLQVDAGAWNVSWLEIVWHFLTDWQFDWLRQNQLIS